MFGGYNTTVYDSQDLKAMQEYAESIKKLARSGVKELIETKPKKGEYVPGYDSKATVIAQLCIAYNLLNLNNSIDLLIETIIGR